MTLQVSIACDEIPTVPMLWRDARPADVSLWAWLGIQHGSRIVSLSQPWPTNQGKQRARIATRLLYLTQGFRLRRTSFAAPDRKLTGA
jgi:hypothetical protein